ncbi:MAG: hypothetical protein ACYDHN_02675 [Solirubrobacteraceae bacterium]
MSGRRLVRAIALVSTLAFPAAVTPAGSSAHAPPLAHPTGVGASAAPVVQSMIVGASGSILSPARTVTANATSVRVGGRSCAVAAGTPLAVLVAVARAGGPGFSLRDYGRCGSSQSSSGQLFVSSLAGETNRGQNGWGYKVNGISGATGAADLSGPSGNGQRLRSGQQVLWFWCAAYAGGCQRSLEVAASTVTVRRGGTLSVAVTGRDNDGHAALVAGAIVRLDTDFASTGAGGRATLYAPSTPGRYLLSATRRGLVPSFPETIVVR